LFTTGKIAIVSVINDLVTDSRVNRTCNVLQECGYKVVLIGRKLPASLPLPAWSFRAIRMRLLFTSGPLFYFFFNLRLFLHLLFRNANLLYANDLDTLLPNYLVSRLKNLPLIYDSHELFCEVPELQHTPLKKKIWERLEKCMVPRLNTCITVNQSIASIFESRYGVPFHVIRNISDRPRLSSLRSRSALGLPAHVKIILLQGAGINVHRGAEELVAAMVNVNAMLLIIGGGDVWNKLENIVKDLGLENKVRLIPKVPKEDLRHYTRQADLGVSIDKPTSMNYVNSLPNKIFDYIEAGIPIMASRLPEIESIITACGIGDFIDNHEPIHIGMKLNEMLSSPQYDTWKNNIKKAAEQFNWLTEREVLKGIIEASPGPVK
jgi:glycosyltransferase involved in cell wall biosynthesis